MKLARKPSNKEFTSVIHSIDIHRFLREKNGGIKYDRYREEWERASSLNYIPPYPLQLDFELNNSCNFSCKMCTWSAESSTDKGKKIWLDFEVFREIVDDGVKKGLKAIRFNYINEPLIRKDIVRFISYAKGIGILDTYFSTNGSLLNEAMAESLIDSGLDRIQVSIDAFTQETFNQIRPGGNLAKIKKNINKFIEIRTKKKKKSPFLRVNFVKTKDNINELNDFIEYWSSKTDGIGVQNLIDIKKRNFINSCNQKRIRFRCAQPFYHMTIRYNGNILPCCAFFGAETPIAVAKTSKTENLSQIENLAFKRRDQVNLSFMDIEEVWNGNKMKFFRDIHKKGEYWRHPICYECVINSSHTDETLEL